MSLPRRERQIAVPPEARWLEALGARRVAGIDTRATAADRAGDRFRTITDEGPADDEGSEP